MKCKHHIDILNSVWNPRGVSSGACNYGASTYTSEKDRYYYYASPVPNCGIHLLLEINSYSFSYLFLIGLFIYLLAYSFFIVFILF